MLGFLSAIIIISNPQRLYTLNYYFPPLFSSAIISSIICFGTLYHIYGVKEARTDRLSESPLDCLYFSVITWTTIGYGDFIPASKISRALAAYEGLLGYFTMAAVFALAVTIASAAR
jgi:hypothetical protein